MFPPSVAVEHEACRGARAQIGGESRGVGAGGGDRDQQPMDRDPAKPSEASAVGAAGGGSVLALLCAMSADEDGHFGQPCLNALYAGVLPAGVGQELINCSDAGTCLNALYAGVLPAGLEGSTARKGSAHRVSMPFMRACSLRADAQGWYHEVLPAVSMPFMRACSLREGPPRTCRGSISCCLNALYAGVLPALRCSREGTRLCSPKGAHPRRPRVMGARPRWGS